MEFCKFVLKSFRQPRLAVGHDLRLALESRYEERRSAAAMRKDPADVREACCHPGQEQLEHRSRRVGWKFNRLLAHVRNELTTALRTQWMRAHDGVTAVELFVHGGETRVAQVLAAVAGHQPDSVRVERIRSE